MAQPPGGAGSGSPDADPHGSSDQYLVTRTWPGGPVTPSHRPTEVESPHPRTETAGYGPGTPDAPAEGRDGPGTGETVSIADPAGVVRIGPGVPVSSPVGRAGPTAEQVWRTGQLPAPPRRRRRVRRVAGSALTVALLAAAGVVLFLRLHHGPLRVTGVAITRQVGSGCVADVTGRIATNGSAGTVSYQWIFQPQSGAPQPASQSVVAGQDAVYVTVTVQGQGHGSAAENVTLQVLGPGTGTASARVVVSC
jgi:hypothetical protein